MPKKIEYFICLAVLFLCLISTVFAQESRRTTVSSVSRNSYAPNLYAERLDFTAMLVYLPGANTSGSNWQTSYEIYFVPETDFDNSIKKIGRREPLPRDFSKKILLASGSFSKKNLQNLSERIFEKKDILLKTKIPDSAKTEFAKIIVFYTVKIYDANLKQNALTTSLFITPPFIDNRSEKEPRRSLFLNFFVADKGELYTSNEERSKTDTRW